MKYLKKEMVDMIIVVANIEHLLYIRHCFSDSQVLTHLILFKKIPIKGAIISFLQINKLRQREVS